MKLVLIFSILLIACQTAEKSSPETASPKSEFDDVSSLYATLSPEKIYSTSVQDTFKIFRALPKGYGDSSALKYPLILVLDANAYFESVVSEMKFGTLTQDFPKSIIVGIGYKNFWMMDSLRNRDYTPIAEKDFPGYGGATKFKSFIDEELLPKLRADFKVDDNKIVLMGHSLGGYFILHYIFSSYEKKEFKINNFIAASPPLDGNEKHFFTLESKLSKLNQDLPVKLFLSMGSLDRDTTLQENVFEDFKRQVESHHYKGAKLKFVELGNFEHMDAAMPGFMKGLIFIFSKE